jgi:hypothetical protein
VTAPATTVTESIAPVQPVAIATVPHRCRRPTAKHPKAGGHGCVRPRTSSMSRG